LPTLMCVALTGVVSIASRIVFRKERKQEALAHKSAGQ
jgi:hypothetical protein